MGKIADEVRAALVDDRPAVDFAMLGSSAAYTCDKVRKIIPWIERIEQSSAEFFPSHDAWIAFVATHGESEARRLVVTKLRAAADLIERGDAGAGDIYGVGIVRPVEIPCTGEAPIEVISVALSRYWGGE